MLLLNAYQHAALIHIHRTSSHITSLLFLYTTQKLQEITLFFFSCSLFFQGQKPGLTDVQAELDRMTRKPDSMVTANNTPATENEAWARQQHCPIWKSTCKDIKEKKKMLFMTKIPPHLVYQSANRPKVLGFYQMYRLWCCGGKRGRYLKRCNCFSLFSFPDPFLCLFVCLFVVINFWCGMAGQVMGALSFKGGSQTSKV